MPSLLEAYQGLTSDPNFANDPEAQQLAAQAQAKAASIYRSVVSDQNFAHDSEAQQMAHQFRAAGLVHDPTQGGLVSTAPRITTPAPNATVPPASLGSLPPAFPPSAPIGFGPRDPANQSAPSTYTTTGADQSMGAVDPWVKSHPGYGVSVPPPATPFEKIQKYAATRVPVHNPIDVANNITRGAASAYLGFADPASDLLINATQAVGDFTQFNPGMGVDPAKKAVRNVGDIAGVPMYNQLNSPVNLKDQISQAWQQDPYSTGAQGVAMLIGGVHGFHGGEPVPGGFHGEPMSELNRGGKYAAGAIDDRATSAGTKPALTWKHVDATTYAAPGGFRVSAQDGGGFELHGPHGRIGGDYATPDEAMGAAGRHSTYQPRAKGRFNGPPQYPDAVASPADIAKTVPAWRTPEGYPSMSTNGMYHIVPGEAAGYDLHGPQGHVGTFETMEKAQAAAAPTEPPAHVDASTLPMAEAYDGSIGYAPRNQSEMAATLQHGFGFDPEQAAAEAELFHHDAMAVQRNGGRDLYSQVVIAHGADGRVRAVQAVPKPAETVTSTPAPLVTVDPASEAFKNTPITTVHDHLNMGTVDASNPAAIARGFDMTAPGGVLDVVVPHGLMDGTGREARAFGEWLAKQDHSYEPAPDGSGYHVVIQKPGEATNVATDNKPANAAVDAGAQAGPAAPVRTGEQGGANATASGYAPESNGIPVAVAAPVAEAADSLDTFAAGAQVLDPNGNAAEVVSRTADGRVKVRYANGQTATWNAGGVKAAPKPQGPIADPFLQSHANRYISTAGLPVPKGDSAYRQVDRRAALIADAYDAMTHEPSAPAVSKSYAALKKEIHDQWNYATRVMGIKFEPWSTDGQPYANSAEMIADVRNNKHLYFFRGGAMPADHPLAALAPETSLSYNDDELRAVHDLFGHATNGYEFGPRGEENAWIKHSQMFTPDAIPALTTETKGQNSWVNYGVHLRDSEGKLIRKGEQGFIAPVDRPFAEQKAGLLPSEYWRREDINAQGAHVSGRVRGRARVAAGETEPTQLNQSAEGVGGGSAADGRGNVRGDQQGEGAQGAAPTHESRANLARSADALMRERLAAFSGKPYDAALHIVNNPHLMRQGVSSLFIGDDGAVHVLSPHRHTQVAATVLRENNVPLSNSADAAKVLTEHSGFVRTQLYPNGIGAEIHLNTPPSRAQLASIYDLYKTTSGDTFVAEVYAPDGSVRNIRTFPALQRAVEDARPDTLFQHGEPATDSLGFYSHAQRVIEQKMGGKANSTDLAKMLVNAGVKPDEMHWSGLDDFLAKSRAVTKQEVLDHLAQNNVQLHEVTNGEPRAEAGIRFSTEPTYHRPQFGESVWVADNEPNLKITKYDNGGIDAFVANGPDRSFPRRTTFEDAVNDLKQHFGGDSSIGADTTPTKYSTYQIPGGSNYREHLLTLPSETPKIEALKSALQDASKAKVEATERYIRMHDEPHTAQELAEANAERHRLNIAEADAKRALEQENQSVYRSSHWDEPNVLAHIRTSDRVGPNGEKILHVEEVQSDWGQSGRKHGFTDPELQKRNAEEYARLTKERDAIIAKYNNSGNLIAARMKMPHEERVRESEISRRIVEVAPGTQQGVPSMPFAKTWHELAAKRILKMAADGGYDRVAWTPGAEQAERYDLSKQVDTLRWFPKSNGVAGDIQAFKDGKEVVYKGDVKASNLPDVVGKEVANRLINSPTEISRHRDGRVIAHDLTGQALKVGGEGMKGFYDKILPDTFNKLGKRFGAKVGETGISTSPDAKIQYAVVDSDGIGQGSYGTKAEADSHATSSGDTVRLIPTKPDVTLHSIDITPEMKRSLMTEGQPLFQSKGKPVEQAGATATAPKGSIDFTDHPAGRALVRFFKDADASTVVHELAHLVRRNLPELDQAILRDHYGVKGETWSRAQEEAFARDKERYHHDGVAPTPKLVPVFAKISAWMRDIYKQLKGSSIEGAVSPVVKDVLDRWYGKESETAARVKAGRTAADTRTAPTSASGRTQGALPRLTVFRHGETGLNAQGRIRGWSDGPDAQLNANGKQQAHDLGKQMARLPRKPDVIVSSDLGRAKETASIVSGHTGIPVHHDADLRPWNVGKYTGEKHEDVLHLMERDARETPDKPIDGGESFNQFKNRFLTAVQRAETDHAGKDIAISTHSRGERVLEAWYKAGRPANFDVDLDTMFASAAKVKQPGEMTVLGGTPKMAGPTNVPRLGLPDVTAEQTVHDTAKRLPVSPVKTHASTESASVDLADRLDTIVDNLRPGELPTEADGTQPHPADVWTAARRLTARATLALNEAERAFEGDPSSANRAALEAAQKAQQTRQAYSAEVGRQLGQGLNAGNIVVDGESSGQAIADRVLTSPRLSMLSSGGKALRTRVRAQRWKPVSEDDFASSVAAIRGRDSLNQDAEGQPQVLHQSPEPIDHAVLKAKEKEFTNVGLYHFAKVGTRGRVDFGEWSDAMRGTAPGLSDNQLNSIWQKTRIEAAKRIGDDQAAAVKVATTDALIPMLGNRKAVSAFIDQINDEDPRLLDAWIHGDSVTNEQKDTWVRAVDDNKVRPDGTKDKTPPTGPIAVARQWMADAAKAKAAAERGGRGSKYGPPTPQVGPRQGPMTPGETLIQSIAGRVTGGREGAVKVMARIKNSAGGQAVIDKMLNAPGTLSIDEERIVANAIKPNLKPVSKSRSFGIAQQMQTIMRDARSGRLGTVTGKDLVRQHFQEKFDTQAQKVAESKGGTPEAVAAAQTQAAANMEPINRDLAKVKSDDWGAMAEIVSKHDAKGWDRFANNFGAYYRGNLLSNTLTLPAILASHVASNVFEKAFIDPLASLIDVGYSKAHDIPRAIVSDYRDVAASTKMIPTAAREAGFVPHKGYMGDTILGAGENALTISGHNPSHTPSRGMRAEFDVGISKFADRFNNPTISGAIRATGAVINAPWRFWGRQHGAVFHVAGVPIYDNALRDAARLQATNEARVGTIGKDEVNARAKELYDSPTAELEKQAGENYAEKMFSNPNAWADFVAKLDKYGPAGKAVHALLQPFANIPANIAGKAVETATPLGVIKGLSILMKGAENITPAERANAFRSIVRSVLGTSTAVAAYYAAPAAIHGVNEKRHQYSPAVDAGGRRTEIGRLAPAVNALSSGVTVRDQGRGLAGIASKDYLKSVAGEGPYMGLQDEIGKLFGENADSATAGQAVEKTAAQWLYGLVPGSSLVNAISAQGDPTHQLRQKDGFLDEMAGHFPGPPMRTKNGQALNRQALPPLLIKGTPDMPQLPIPEGGGLKLLRSVPLDDIQRNIDQRNDINDVKAAIKSAQAQMKRDASHGHPWAQAQIDAAVADLARKAQKAGMSQ